MARFINPGDFAESQAFYQSAHCIVSSDSIMSSIGCRHPDRERIQQSLHRHLVGIYHACGPDLEGKKILDLGCGSNGGTYEYDHLEQTRWQPWLCRLLHAIGVRPIGIDVGVLDNEPFQHYQIDLAKEDALKAIPDASIDLVCAFSFLDSPELELRLRNWKGIAENPTYNAAYSARKVMPVLFPQIKRVLKPDGTFIHSEEWGFEINENGLVDRGYAYPPSY